MEQLWFVLKHLPWVLGDWIFVLVLTMLVLVSVYCYWTGQ